MEVLDLHALLGQWIVSLACLLLEMFTRSTRSSRNINFTATTISDRMGAPYIWERHLSDAFSTSELFLTKLFVNQGKFIHIIAMSLIDF